MDAPGTHTLTPEQQDAIEKQYGIRYVGVETAVYGIGNNRKLRRLAKKGKRLWST